uniref:Uncharacterized protein n=1 Tax=Anguilla anguilla TaxID=7936 RepID=A0A0E9WIU7_ANGAN
MTIITVYSLFSIIVEVKDINNSAPFMDNLKENKNQGI